MYTRFKNTVTNYNCYYNIANRMMKLMIVLIDWLSMRVTKETNKWVHVPCTNFQKMRCQNVKDVKSVKLNLYVLDVEINGIAVEHVR